MKFNLDHSPVTDNSRALLGFGLGLCIMVAVVHIFTVNNFDFENMQRGVHYLLSGVNPWAEDTRLEHFYNPPFAVLFLWPMLFTSPKIYLVMGGAFLFAFIFYHKAWIALAWFATNTFLWLVAAGGIDMFVIGAGLLILMVGGKYFNKWYGLLLRVTAYGLLLVKPQGSIFIVILFILLRRDWKGFLISLILYGAFFLPLYPDWFYVLLHNPPLAQTEITHTIWAKFGPGVAIAIAILVILARRWKYWQLGGALAGIVSPYGMPGLPIFLILTGVKKFVAIPIVVIYSGLLALLTWINLPTGIEFSEYRYTLIAIYHLGMLTLTLALACISDSSDTNDSITVGDQLRRRLLRN
jgi:hypothetical protein